MILCVVECIAKDPKQGKSVDCVKDADSKPKSLSVMLSVTK